MLRSSLPANSSAAPTIQSLYNKTVLDNGIRIITESIPYVRSVSIGIWANVGSRDEGPSSNGLSHMLEHMVFKGTKNRSIREIARSLESLGGYLNAFTTKETTCYHARILDRHLPRAIDVLSDLVLNGTFKKEELEKEKGVVIEELKHAEDDPEDIIHDYFDKALFPTHPIGNPIIGTEANLNSFKRQDLLDHIERFYLPSRIVIAAAGNLVHADVVRLVEKAFGNYHPKGKEIARTPAPVRNIKPGLFEYSRPINQAHICLGTVSRGIQHKDRYPLLVMNALLGEGMSSRLHQNIREKYGFAYTVYSFLNMLSDTGLFGAYIGTDKKHVDHSIELIFKEFAKLRVKPISRAELERTKSQIKGVMMLGLENMSGRMMRLGGSELYFGKFTSLDAIIRKVDAVTPEAIARVSNELFQEKKFSTVIIHPA